MGERSTEAGALRVERVLLAPIEDVFAAWTEPSRMAQWLSPRGRAEVDADVVVGGHLRAVMIDGDIRIEHEGEFLEVRPPARLSFTWRSPFTGEDPSVVTVELFDEDGSTRLVLRHDHLPREAAASHEGGWGAILDHLATALSSDAARRAR